MQRIASGTPGMHSTIDAHGLGIHDNRRGSDKKKFRVFSVRQRVLTAKTDTVTETPATVFAAIATWFTERLAFTSTCIIALDSPITLRKILLKVFIYFYFIPYSFLSADL
jgi:hypothetical protein